MSSQFNTIVLPHLGDARALARWLTSSSADAEDILQEACIRAYRGLDAFAGENARAWLLTIVRNTAYSWWRKHRQARFISTTDPEIEEIENPHEWDAETPESMLLAQDEARKLQASVDALSMNLRTTLQCHLQGLRYREIADATGVSIGTVMSRLARARGRVIADMRCED